MKEVFKASEGEDIAVLDVDSKKELHKEAIREDTNTTLQEKIIQPKYFSSPLVKYSDDDSGTTDSKKDTGYKKATFSSRLVKYTDDNNSTTNSNDAATPAESHAGVVFREYLEVPENIIRDGTETATVRPGVEIPESLISPRKDVFRAVDSEARITFDTDKSELFKSVIRGDASEALKGKIIQPNYITTKDDTIIGGAAGSARYTTGTGNIFSSPFVHCTSDDETRGTMTVGGPGFVGTVGDVVGREFEKTVGAAGNDDSISGRARAQATKYGYKAGKYAIKGSKEVIDGSYRLGRYGSRLYKDIKSGNLTGREAAKGLLKDSGKSVVSSGKSIGKVILKESGQAVADFRGSDDLGMQALTKPKDFIVRTYRTIKIVNASSIVKLIKRILTNPAVVKGLAAVGCVALFFVICTSVITSITSIIPVITLKSDEFELTNTYDYITELDAKLEFYKIIQEEIRSYIPPIDEYHYYLNGVATSRDNMKVYTNADLFLMYLDSKYDDYQLNIGLTTIFGDTVVVKSEIERIHALLHQVTTNRWTEEIVHEETYTNEDGEELPYTWIEYIYHLDILLTTKSFDDYLTENWDDLLEVDEQQKFEALGEAGTYTMRKEIGSPFVGVNWSNHMTCRFGWRIHPITGVLEKHPAIDIAMPGGTPINACMSGTVTVPPFMGSGYGNYVVVTNNKGDSTLYAHMSSVAVSSGDLVNTGDVIGYVGTTGASTGNHLHLEYKKGSKALNPLIFVYCEES